MAAADAPTNARAPRVIRDVSRRAWGRSEERRVGKEWRYWRDWSSDVCSSDLADAWRSTPSTVGTRSVGSEASRSPRSAQGDGPADHGTAGAALHRWPRPTRQRTRARRVLFATCHVGHGADRKSVV